MMKLASLFSDHLVLQREQSVPVWGWAEPGTGVTVAFAGQRKSGVAGADGKWQVKLDPMPACAEPRELMVESKTGGQKIVVSDVLIGEVWVASGQSNMWWSVGDSLNADTEVASADHPLIRLLTVPQKAALQSAKDFDAAWCVCSPKAVWGFSAVAYYFGRHLQRELGVPVGLINSSWGGTRIEAWTSKAALSTDPGGRRVLAEYESMLDDPATRASVEEFNRDPVAWERNRAVPDPGNTGVEQGWASADFDDAGWETMQLPNKWQHYGHQYSGIFWFRRVIDVPAAWAGKDLLLRIGACDKHDTTYFNNTLVGATGWETPNAWCQQRAYRVPGKLVRAGRNVVSTRVYSYRYDGGMIGPPDAMCLALMENQSSAGENLSSAIPLSGLWRYKIEHNFGLQAPVPVPLGEGNHNTPNILYDNMIQPLLPFGLRGAIWYQGESNAGTPKEYQTLFPLLICDWRRAFEQPELQFFFVQLANYTDPQKQPVESGWAELREAQTMTLSLPHTGMALAIDIGEAGDIHPRNKQDAGRRLAIAALGQVHGFPIVYSGPMYRSHRIENDSIRLYFDHVDGGLSTRDGAAPKAFAIAGADGKFEWAEARIEDQTIVVRSAQVPNPVAVRYAWANNPPVNLYNSAGLPAVPFRTDMEK